jgi:hypothetical protein
MWQYVLMVAVTHFLSLVYPITLASHNGAYGVSLSLSRQLASGSARAEVVTSLSVYEALS